MNYIKALKLLSDIESDLIISAYPTEKKVLNSKWTHIVIVAACLLMVISSIIPIINKHQQGIDTSSLVSSSKEQQKTLEILSQKKLFGEMKLTKLAFNDVSHILNTVKSNDDINKVYEDNEYLYHFQTNGEIIELQQKLSREGEEKVNLETIKNRVNSVFDIYLPKENQKEYDIKIVENKDAYPTWTVTAKKYDNGICISDIYIAFTNSGDLKTIVVPDNLSEIQFENGYEITKERAVDIALYEAKKDKYGLIFSKNNAEEISIQIQTGQSGKVYYRVTINNLHFRDIPDAVTAFGVDIDVQTGEIVECYQYK